MNQISLFYQSHMTHAASLHAQMAEMQRKAGRPDLAQDSERVAVARRISAANMDMGTKEALDYGQWAAKQV